MMNCVSRRTGKLEASVVLHVAKSGIGKDIRLQPVEQLKDDEVLVLALA
jgi:hypothetical protein